MKDVLIYLSANKLLGTWFACPNDKAGKNFINDAFVNKRSTNIFA